MTIPQVGKSPQDVSASIVNKDIEKVSFELTNSSQGCFVFQIMTM